MNNVREKAVTQNYKVFFIRYRKLKVVFLLFLNIKSKINVETHLILENSKREFFYSVIYMLRYQTINLDMIT